MGAVEEMMCVVCVDVTEGGPFTVVFVSAAPFDDILLLILWCLILYLLLCLYHASTKNHSDFFHFHFFRHCDVIDCLS